MARNRKRTSKNAKKSSEAEPEVDQEVAGPSNGTVNKLFISVSGSKRMRIETTVDKKKYVVYFDEDFKPPVKQSDEELQLKIVPGNVAEEKEDIFRDGTFRPPITPFELPHLLHKILNYLPMKDWKNCREVCSTWNEACSESIGANKFQLNIKDRMRLKSLVTTNHWGYNQNPNIYRNIKLPEDVSLTSGGVVRFFDDFGKHIKCLTISKSWSVDGLRMVLFQKCPNLEELHLMGTVPATKVEQRIFPTDNPSPKLPNLKKLVFYITNAHYLTPPVYQQTLPPDTTGVNYFVKLLIIDLLAVAPNLEWIQCPNKRDMKKDKTFCSRMSAEYGCTATDIEASFNKMNQFIAQKLFSSSHNANPKLSRLNLYLRLNARGMEKLALKEYPLQFVDIHVRFEDQEGLISLLQTLGGTLKHLRLTTDHKLRINFCCAFLTQLETLHLEDYAGDLVFIGDIPKLSSLSLHYFNSTLFVSGRDRNGQTPSFSDSTLKSLTIENLLSSEQQAKCIKKIGILLPKLKELKLDKVIDRDLQKIYDCLLNLEKLHIVSMLVSNMGLSGFTEADNEAILDEGYEVARFKEYEGLRRLPHIGYLKELKSFTISGDLKLLSSPFRPGRQINTLHGLWILHGICCLRTLRSLTIHSVTMTGVEVKQMFRKLNLARLELVNCNVDDATLNWVKKKLRTTATEFIYTKTEA